MIDERICVCYNCITNEKGGISMALTEAQKRAQQRYREKKGGTAGTQRSITATVSPAEAERIKAALLSVNMSNAEALKRVADRIAQGDDLRKDYDRANNRLIDNE